MNEFRLRLGKMSLLCSCAIGEALTLRSCTYTNCLASLVLSTPTHSLILLASGRAVYFYSHLLVSCFLVEYFLSFNMYTSFLALSLLITAPLISAHGLVASAVGDLGGKGQGLGVVSGGVNSQADVTVFNGKSAFGETQGVRIFRSLPPATSY
jgi:hypothetical protein